MDNFIDRFLITPLPGKGQEVNVGLPKIGELFTVHPTDFAPNIHFYGRFYSEEDRCSYLISGDYPEVNELFKSGIYNLSKVILYRGIYTSGTEFILPLALYSNEYEASVRTMLDEGKSGKWLIREKTINLVGNSYFNYKVADYALAPKWSNLSFKELVNKTFENYFIDSPTHRVTSQFKPIKSPTKSEI